MSSKSMNARTCGSIKLVNFVINAMINPHPHDSSTTLTREQNHYVILSDPETQREDHNNVIFLKMLPHWNTWDRCAGYLLVSMGLKISKD